MDTRRLILVMIFTFSSFLLWENWQKYNQPKLAVDVAAAPAASGTPTPTPSVKSAGAPAPVATATAPSTAETFTITTDLVKATVSAQGGDLVNLELRNYA